MHFWDFSKRAKKKLSAQSITNILNAQTAGRNFEFPRAKEKLLQPAPNAPQNLKQNLKN